MIHKRLSAVPGRPAISICGTPTEKVFEYLDYILKPIMQDSWSYIPEGAILVTADVTGLYASISPEADLEALRKKLN